MSDKIPNQIFTIGHSTRNVDELVEVLRCYNVLVLVDVRHFPSSRRNPQFNKNNLEINLPESGTQYYWIEELVGFKEGGYQKYMESEDFNEGLKKLMKIAKQNSTAIMCAELLWFKCHRGSIASFLTKNGWEVIHIFDKKRTQIHRLRKEH
jgi:uncharacterized protein (DUF488 family)